MTVIGAADGPASLPPCDLVIDGAYGTGFHGAYDAPRVAPGTPVLAIDIPSGVDADTGDGAGPAMRGHPHRDLRRPQARPAARGRARPMPATVEVADIGIALPAVRRWR